MDKLVKEAYLIELKQLMDTFFQLQSNPNATHRDHARIASKIHQVCDTLDALDKDGVH